MTTSRSTDYRPGDLVMLSTGPLVGVVTARDGDGVSVELTVPPGMLRPADPHELHPTGPRG